MILVAHRINTVSSLKKLSSNYGVEVDLRDFKNTIHISHDPFKVGENFYKYLKSFNHRFLICNIKSERIEFKVLNLIKKFNIKNYFFLDSSFPMKVICLKKNINKQSIRFSKYENLPKTKFFNKIDWIWFDTYGQLPSVQKLKKLKKIKKKICMVCPKLHDKKFDKKKITNFIKKNHYYIDMVCTKKKNFIIYKLQ